MSRLVILNIFALKQEASCKKTQSHFNTPEHVLTSLSSTASAPLPPKVTFYIIQCVWGNSYLNEITS